MADCGSLTDAMAGFGAGPNCVGTTLYTNARPRMGSDFDLVEELVQESPVPVIAEGRIRTPEDFRRCLELGAFAVVVGTAITHPTTITRNFAASAAAGRPSHYRRCA
ncbi:HisA/HisF-related TIM barrel protein (plasmid) [Arthrobacter sp. zg-Y820]|nr:HisA/HisF-related TIM barrel protein [Arthrobacter sp. zg-Y820]MCC9198529.1 tRNA-dihydrouridine synthase [Arthrobacter sp. zg-Y820]WIB11272.1 HisA/HisF-related TIM barrel protein [Arthrobacter sp. zg-Y820]